MEDKEKERTALEVPVQEQKSIVVGFDEAILKSKLIRINKLANELQEEINSLPSTINVTYQNS